MSLVRFDASIFAVWTPTAALRMIDLVGGNSNRFAGWPALPQTNEPIGLFEITR